MAYKTYFPRTSNNDAAIEEWAKGLIDKWLDKMDMLNIHETGALANSFRYMVEWETRSVGRGVKVEFLKRIQFLYLYYGKMVDYGIGRGMDIQERFRRGSDHSKEKRQRKRWVDEPFLAEHAELLRIITLQTAAITRVIMRTEFEGEKEIVFRTKSRK